MYTRRMYCIFLLLSNFCVFVKFTDLIFIFMNLMNNCQIDGGNENPTQNVPSCLRGTTEKTPVMLVDIGI